MLWSYSAEGLGMVWNSDHEDQKYLKDFYVPCLSLSGSAGDVLEDNPVGRLKVFMYDIPRSVYLAGWCIYVRPSVSDYDDSFSVETLYWLKIWDWLFQQIQQKMDREGSPLPHAYVCCRGADSIFFTWKCCSHLEPWGGGLVLHSSVHNMWSHVEWTSFTF